MKQWVKLVLALVVGMLFWPQSTAVAAVNDFTITDYQIQYKLDKDSENRSTLETKETITANFTQPDQNHGIERSIPKNYDNHSTSLSIKTVTDQNGNTLPYSTYESNGNEVVRIGDANRYVSGIQNYIIVYTQRDVTRYFSDTNRDEFYWDTNGTDWQVPISNLKVDLTVSDAIRQDMTNDASCYKGKAGSREACEVVKDGSVVIVNGKNLLRGENITVAIGFDKDTFAQYQLSISDIFVIIATAVFVITSFIGIAVIAWLFVRWSQASNRTKEMGTIVPEYLPPKGVSVTTSASLIRTTSAFPAQLIDFAVRHYLKIYQTKEKSMWSEAKYDIEITKDINNLTIEEKKILNDIFDGRTQLGSRISMDSLQNSSELRSRMKDNNTKFKNLIRGSYGLRHKNPKKSSRFKKTGVILLACGAIFLSPVLLLASGVAFLMSYLLWPLTDKGLNLRRYLDGLKMYIQVAEQDRLKMLQSPEGAAKVGTITVDTAQIVKLYERVLPYAILFGQEKEWNKQLGLRYESTNSQPDWYSGTGAVFNAAVFSSAISSFTTTSNYSSASSSSSGGSSGGGSSGGGGGGGGGGGW